MKGFVPKKRYFIPLNHITRPQKFYMRDKVITRYRAALETYRKLEIFKQICVVFLICRDHEEFVTKGELVAFMREKLSMDLPTKYEVEYINNQIAKFRKWLDSYICLVVYVKHEHIPNIKAMEWVYRPIVDKDDYKKVNIHMTRTQAGIIGRNKNNEELLKMTKKQIEKRINELREELDLEAQGL